MNRKSNTPFTLSKQSKLPDLLQANEEWVHSINQTHPTLFPEHNAQGQEPHTLFIGCSDSRYNENVLGVVPGEIFTWRSIANLCLPDDSTFLSTLEYAIICLKVNKLVICGHTDCGGIMTCLRGGREALKSQQNCHSLYQYLGDIDQLYSEHANEIDQLPDERTRGKYLCIQNLKRQFNRLVHNDIVRNAIKKGQLEVYGLLYNVDTGLLETVDTLPPVTSIE